LELHHQLNGYIFVNDDGVKFFAVDKNRAADKIRKMPLDIALDLERESYLWVTKELRITKKLLRTSLVVSP
jgi:hypothetical protein